MDIGTKQEDLAVSSRQIPDKTKQNRQEKKGEGYEQFTG